MVLLDADLIVTRPLDGADRRARPGDGWSGFENESRPLLRASGRSCSALATSALGPVSELERARSRRRRSATACSCRSWRRRWPRLDVAAHLARGRRRRPTRSTTPTRTCSTRSRSPSSIAEQVVALRPPPRADPALRRRCGSRDAAAPAGRRPRRRAEPLDAPPLLPQAVAGADAQQRLLAPADPAAARPTTSPLRLDPQRLPLRLRTGAAARAQPAGRRRRDRRRRARSAGAWPGSRARSGPGRTRRPSRGQLAAMGRPLRVMVGAAGWAGHVFPAFAVARELQTRGHEVADRDLRALARAGRGHGRCISFPSPRRSSSRARARRARPRRRSRRPPARLLPAIREFAPDVALHDLFTLAPAFAADAGGGAAGDDGAASVSPRRAARSRPSPGA